jgi:hypothetical protein
MVRFRVWGQCIDCNFEGPIEYSHIEGEDYSDEEAVGVILVQHCPACDATEHALIPLDYYRQMLIEAVTDEPEGR